MGGEDDNGAGEGVNIGVEIVTVAPIETDDGTDEDAVVEETGVLDVEAADEELDEEVEVEAADETETADDTAVVDVEELLGGGRIPEDDADDVEDEEVATDPFELVTDDALDSEVDDVSVLLTEDAVVIVE